MLCGSAQVTGCRALQRGPPFALPVCRALLLCAASPLGSLIGSRMPNYKSASMGFFVRASNEVPVVRHELARSSLFAINSKAKIGHLLLPDSIE